MENYLQLVAGTTLNDWLSEVTPDSIERNVAAWTAIHICFAFYHIYGHPLPSADELDLMETLFQRFNPMFANIHPCFAYFFYHFVIGTYGHIHRDPGYLQQVRIGIAHIFNNLYDPFILTPDPAKE